MKFEPLRGILHAVPFEPFTIHVPDGRSLRVPHPDFIAVGGNGKIVIVISPPHVSPSFSVVDVPVITELEVEGAPSSGA